MRSTSFETLPIKKKMLTQPLEGRYRIYKDAREFMVVEAATAKQALEASGIDKPFKIERERVGLARVLNEQALTAHEEKKEAETVAPPVEAPAEASAPAVENAATVSE